MIFLQKRKCNLFELIGFKNRIYIDLILYPRNLPAVLEILIQINPIACFAETDKFIGSLESSRDY